MTDDPLWRIAYGRLTAELMKQAPHMAVNQTSVTYGDLWEYTSDRYVAPPGFTGGTLPVEGGVFIPADSQLGVAPGYVVPLVFWEYINRGDLFANGWLYAIGLPLTNAFEVRVTHAGEQRMITMQAFERAVLTYNPHNPPAWQVERGNIGTDAWLAAGQTPPDAHAASTTLYVSDHQYDLQLWPRSSHLPGYRYFLSDRQRVCRRDRWRG